ncbi:RNA polymerase sigma factor [candidate division KSB1 bacterium]
MNENISNIKNQLLVMAAQDGDVKAMDKLVSRWQKELWYYVFSLIGNRHAAWDVTQECWLNIIKSINKLNDPMYFKAWAFRIATNKSIDWIKKKSKYQHKKLDSIELINDQKENDLLVRELLQNLKNKSRIILNLYYFEQFSITEISIVLNVPQGTVKSRLFKARQELKQLWDKYFNE